MTPNCLYTMWQISTPPLTCLEQHVLKTTMKLHHRAGLEQRVLKITMKLHHRAGLEQHVLKITMKLHHRAGLGLLNALCSGLKNVHDRHAAVVETCFRLVHNRESAKKERDETVWNLSRPKKLWHCQRPFSLCRPLLLFHRCSKLSHIGRVHPIPYSCTNVQKWLRDISLERGRRGGVKLQGV